MLGPEGVTGYITAALRGDLPTKLAELRTRYGIDDDSLRDIDRYYRTDVLDIAIDRPPFIIIAEQESDTIQGPIRMASDGGGGTVFEYRYRIGIYAWARGVDADSTALARQRYGLAVREVLLQRLGLGDPDPGTCVLDPVTITEAYSPLGQVDTSREVIAGTGIICEYRTQEYLPPRHVGPPLGAVIVTGETGP